MVEIFGEVISSYPDSQAVEDGILVPITEQDRVTRACWEWMADRLGDSPPNGWPVELMGYIGAAKGAEGRDDRALAASKGLTEQHRRQATRVWEENIGGGVYKLYADTRGEAIRGISGSDTTDDVTLWIIPNELGGVTLMFPSDY
jgi:hypothetical protein